jgi:signal transduction histidine kinase
MLCKLAHDMRNTLTAIIGQCDLTLEDLPAESPCVQRLQRISALAWRMADTIDRSHCDVAAALEEERATRPRQKPVAAKSFVSEADLLALFQRRSR